MFADRVRNLSVHFFKVSEPRGDGNFRILHLDRKIRLKQTRDCSQIYGESCIILTLKTIRHSETSCYKVLGLSNATHKLTCTIEVQIFEMNHLITMNHCRGQIITAPFPIAWVSQGCNPFASWGKSVNEKRCRPGIVPGPHPLHDWRPTSSLSEEEMKIFTVLLILYQFGSQLMDRKQNLSMSHRSCTTELEVPETSIFVGSRGIFQEK